MKRYCLKSLHRFRQPSLPRHRPSTSCICSKIKGKKTELAVINKDNIYSFIHNNKNTYKLLLDFKKGNFLLKHTDGVKSVHLRYATSNSPTLFRFQQVRVDLLPCLNILQPFLQFFVGLSPGQHNFSFFGAHVLDV